MDEKTTMAQGLHSTDDSAGYDAACKRVLSEKAILARIMKACLAEYRDCPVRDIEEKYIEEASSAAWIRRTNPFTRERSLTISGSAPLLPTPGS